VRLPQPHNRDCVDPVIALGDHADNVRQEEVSKSLPLEQALPAQRLELSDKEEVEDTGPRLVGPEPIELLTQHVGTDPALNRSDSLLRGLG